MNTRLEKRLADQREVRQKYYRIFGVGVLLILMLAAAIASYYLFSAAFAPPKKNRIIKKDSSFLPSISMSSPVNNKVNILVLGVDQRSDDSGRSDTMFVVTVDTDTKAVSMLSIPRDTRVKIPGYGWDKINHAFALGRHNLSLKAVEELLGVPIDYYTVINFTGFYNIVDAIGGVTLNVEKRMYYEDPYDDLIIDLQPGIQRMDGHTAIKYVRYRDEDGDIGRIERQQKFLKAMVDEVTSPAIIFRIPAIIKEVNTTVQTDLSIPEMLNLVKLLSDAKKSGLKTDMLPGQPINISEINYWQPDIVALREYVAETNGIKSDEKYLNMAQRLKAEYEKSIPTELITEEPSKKSPQPAQALLPPKPSQSVKPGIAPTPQETVRKAPAQVQPVQPVQPQKRGKVKAEVLNASGSAESGSKIAAVMREQGFEVVRISNTTVTNKNTLVIANVTDSAVVNSLTGLPFRYILQVTKNDAKGVQVTIVIGKDFLN